MFLKPDLRNGAPVAVGEDFAVVVVVAVDIPAVQNEAGLAAVTTEEEAEEEEEAGSRYFLSCSETHGIFIFR